VLKVLLVKREAMVQRVQPVKKEAMVQRVQSVKREAMVQRVQPVKKEAMVQRVQLVQWGKDLIFLKQLMIKVSWQIFKKPLKILESLF
jgi:hypothetical protein